MTNEIKEIIETLKKINEEYSLETDLDFEDYEIPNIYLKQFLDYITNQDKKITNLENEQISKYQTLKDLQEENERLKKLCDEYEEEHSTTFEYWKHLVKEDYKSRNEKAIEYIKGWQSFPHTNGSTHNELRNLLNILGGDENE